MSLHRSPTLLAFPPRRLVEKKTTRLKVKSDFDAVEARSTEHGISENTAMKFEK